MSSALLPLFGGGRAPAVPASSTAWAFYNNPLSCVVSQDVPGPPTRKVRVSITYPLQSPRPRREEPHWTNPVQHPEWDPRLLSGHLCALILLDREAQSAPAMASYTRVMMGIRCDGPEGRELWQQTASAGMLKCLLFIFSSGSCVKGKFRHPQWI